MSFHFPSWLLIGLGSITAFTLYWIGLAPTITGEDSGELITAACSLGIPHPPGYPLFTQLGYLFCQLPIDPVAYRLNLMSAFFSAGAVGVFIHTCLVLIRFLNFERYRILALLAGLYLVSIADIYRQGVITEVYGLTLFIQTLLTYFTVRVLCYREHHHALCIAFLSGLAICTHHITWYNVLLGFLVCVLVSRKCLLPRIWAIIACFTVGLVPYLIMFLRAKENPILNWGQPDNLFRFINVITRAQYSHNLDRTHLDVVEQIRQQIILLLEQIPLVLIVIGIYALTRLCSSSRSRNLGMYLILGLVFSGPLSAYLINFSIPFFQQGFYYEEAHQMYSVFFAGHYLCWIMAIAIGVIFLLKEFKRFEKLALLALSILIVIANFSTVSTESMAKYKVVDNLLNDWRKLADEPILMITQWDPFTFPIMYEHLIAHPEKYRNSIFIDFEMLKAPWYHNSIQNRYPNFYQSIKAEAEEYLTLAKKLVRGEVVDSKLQSEKYDALVTRLLNVALETKKVYIAHFFAQGFSTSMVSEKFKLLAQPTIYQVVHRKSEVEATPKLHETVDRLDWFNLKTPRRFEKMYAAYLASLHSEYAGQIIKLDKNRAIWHQKQSMKLSSGYPKFRTTLERLHKKQLSDN